MKGIVSPSLRRVTSGKKSFSSLTTANARDIFSDDKIATKAGPPGRHSNSGMTATVFGAYGSSGRYVVNELGNEGEKKKMQGRILILSCGFIY